MLSSTHPISQQTIPSNLGGCHSLYFNPSIRLMQWNLHEWHNMHGLCGLDKLGPNKKKKTIRPWFCLFVSYYVLNIFRKYFATNIVKERLSWLLFTFSGSFNTVWINKMVFRNWLKFRAGVGDLLQYQKYKDFHQSAGLYLLNILIESLFHHWNPLRTSLTRVAQNLVSW